MVKNLGKRLLPLLLAVILIVSAMPFGVFATKIETVLDGQISIEDTLNKISYSNGTVTATAKGGLFSKNSNTITLTNDSGSKAELKFNYTVDYSSAFTIDGTGAATSGNFSKVLEAGSSVKFKITSNNGYANLTVTLTMSNFSLTAVAESSNVTFDFDSNYGTVTVAGENITSGHTQKDVSLSEGVGVVATAVNGGKFLGWVDAADSAILSTATSYTIAPAQNMTVRAVFIAPDETKPYFMIGALVNESYKHGLLDIVTSNYPTVPSGTHLFDDLHAAAQASGSSNSSKAIVLLNDSTLPAGNYTIPSGSTLVIPIDSKNTYYTTEPRGRNVNFDLDGDGTEQTKDPTKTERYQHTITAYRTLTMESGANIIVNGGMSVPAMHLWAQGATYAGGSPCDNVGMVVMEEGSSITINSGGSLYAYGFITGAGSVTANSGAKVYEYFQIPDFRGGTQSTDMENGVFPISQYYVQNIEVPLRLNSGAQEYSYTSLYMSSQDVSSSVAFIGQSNSMFNLESGYVTKKYDSSTDRLIIELNGDMKVSPVKINLTAIESIDSSKYELPINNNITVTVHSGSNITMGQDIAMLPGSEIIIDEGANCILESNINVYIYDLDQWGKYAGATNEKFIPVVNIAPIPGREKYIRTEADLADAKILINGNIDASKGFVYTTAGGANVCNNGTGTAKVAKGNQTVTYSLVQGSGYVEIPITPAKLKNEDGSYLQSVTHDYTYTDGKWIPINHGYETVVSDPTCTEQGYTTYTCSACGESYIDNYKDASGHSYELVVIEPTCSKEGEKYEKCKVCGDIINREILPIKGHSTETDEKDPTCTEDGYVKVWCTDCDYKYEEVIPALGHNMGDWIIDTAATCEADGAKHKECSACDHIETEEIPAIGHNYNEVVTKPTCEDDGYTTHTCANCQHSYVDSEVEALGHSYGDWIIDTAATCDVDGAKHKECSACDHIETEEIPAIGHNYSEVVTKPTCEDDGYTTHTCANCQHSYVDSKVEALGHSYGDWEIIKNPSHTEEGERKHTCHCGHTETEVIPVIICDIDEAGVGAAELTKMRKFILGTETPTDAEKVLFDMNDDGKITLKDLVNLKKYIVNLQPTV